MRATGAATVRLAEGKIEEIWDKVDLHAIYRRLAYRGPTIAAVVGDRREGSTVHFRRAR